MRPLPYETQRLLRRASLSILVGGGMYNRGHPCPAKQSELESTDEWAIGAARMLGWLIAWESDSVSEQDREQLAEDLEEMLRRGEQ